MQEHFNLSNEAFSRLLKQKVTVKDFYRTAKLFDPFHLDADVSKIGLLYYIDEKGDFDKPPSFPHKKIAKAFSETLNIFDQCMIAEYIELQENKWLESDT